MIIINNNKNARKNKCRTFKTTLYPCLFFIVLCNWRNLSIFLFLSPHLFLCKNRQPAAAISLSKSERRNSIKSDKILNTKKSAPTTRSCRPVCLVIFLRVAPWTLLCKYRHYCYWLHKPCKDINIFILLSYSPNLGCYLVLTALSRRQQTRARKSTIFGQSSQRALHWGWDWAGLHQLLIRENVQFAAETFESEIMIFVVTE